MSDRSIIIGEVLIRDLGSAIQWTAGAAIDADGSPHAYHPDGHPPGLDRLANAGHPGRWYGVQTDTGEKDGQPIVQGIDDPAPGFFVSTTALRDRSKSVNDPTSYLNAEIVCYISVPPVLLHHCGVKMGDVGLAAFHGNSCAIIVGDVGPDDEIGEVSMATARELAIPASPINGGVSRGVEITLWPGSTRGWPRTQQDIEQQVQGLTSLGG